MRILPKGTELTCNKCGRVMCRLNRDMQSGELVAASMFDPVEDIPEDHKKAICPFNDGGYYMEYFDLGAGKRLVLHTKDGWK